jgi:general stress protein 26
MIMTPEQQQFNELLDDFHNAMLVTSAVNGELRARPMAIAGRDSDSDLWFVTDRTSAKIDEIEADPRVLVTMQGEGRYLSLTGHAKVIDDRQKARDLWSEAWRVWFPEGPESAELVLIHIEAIDGEYWDRSGLKRMNYLFKAGQAYVRGERMEVDEEQHQKVHLDR